MTIFYSATHNGFFTPGLHGPRRLSIPDQAWVRPLLEDGSPDPDVEQPTVDIDNPDCKIPADAVPISDALHQSLLDAQAEGYAIAPDATGSPIATAPPTPTPEQILSRRTTQLQDHLDSTACAYGYDDIKSAISYADEPAVAKFQLEGQAFRSWRSLFWDAANTLKNAVLAENRPVPSLAELIAALPTLTLPPP